MGIYWVHPLGWEWICFKLVCNFHQIPTVLSTLKGLWGNVKKGETLQHLSIHIYINTVLIDMTNSSGRVPTCWKHCCICCNLRLLVFLRCKSQRQTHWSTGTILSMCLKPGRTEKQSLVSLVACF